MSLQGSLDTFALPDVLVLLSTTNKTGELAVIGNRGSGTVATEDLEGRLWLDEGKLVGFDVGKAADPAAAVCELLRLTQGSFSFMAGTPYDPGAPVDTEAILAQAQQQLAEWLEIERVVPSVAAWVTLAPEPPAAQVSIRADQWRLIAAIGSGCDVADVVARLSEGELSGCRAVKELADQGLVEIAANLRGGLAEVAATVDAFTVINGTVRSMVSGPSGSDQTLDQGPDHWVDSDGPDALHVVAEAATSAAATAIAAVQPGEGPGGDVFAPVLETLADFDRLVTLPDRSRKARPARGAEDEGDPAAVSGVARRGLGARLAESSRRAAATGDAGDPEAEPLARHLASLGDEDASQDEAPDATALAPAGPEDSGDERGSSAATGADEEADADEPLNRGLLLKFLSSVRN